MFRQQIYVVSSGMWKITDEDQVSTVTQLVRGESHIE